jgi:hypothetical protein
VSKHIYHRGKVNAHCKETEIVYETDDSFLKEFQTLVIELKRVQRREHESHRVDTILSQFILTTYPS